MKIELSDTERRIVRMVITHHLAATEVDNGDLTVYQNLWDKMFDDNADMLAEVVKCRGYLEAQNAWLKRFL